MKNLSIFILTMLILVGCGNNEETTSTDEPNNVNTVNAEEEKFPIPKTTENNIGYYEVYKENLEIGLINVSTLYDDEYVFNVALSNTGNSAVEVNATDFYAVDGNKEQGTTVHFIMEDETEMDSITIEKGDDVTLDVKVTDFKISTEMIHFIYTEKVVSQHQIDWNIYMYDIIGTAEYILASEGQNYETVEANPTSQVDVAASTMPPNTPFTYYDGLSNDIYINTYDMYFLVTGIENVTNYADGTPAVRFDIDFDAFKFNRIDLDAFTLVDSSGNVYKPSRKDWSEYWANVGYISTAWADFSLYFENAPQNGSFSLMIWDGVSSYYLWNFSR